MDEKNKSALICPFCGGSLDYDKERNSLSCPFCGYQKQYENSIADTDRSSVLKKKRHLHFSIILFLLSLMTLVFLVGYQVMNQNSILYKHIHKEEVDFFDAVEISFEGINGLAHLQIENQNVGELKDVPIYISKNENLSNGDQIVLSIEDKLGYAFLTNEKTIVVEGLNEWIDSLEDLSSKEIETIQVQSQEQIENMFKDSKEEGLSYRIKPYKQYLFIQKDVVKLQQVNKFYDCNEIEVSKEGIEPFTFYSAVRYSDLKKDMHDEVSIANIEVCGKEIFGSTKGFSLQTKFIGYLTSKELEEELFKVSESYEFVGSE